MITVVSKRASQPVGEYIGRPSPLGNPFTIGRDGTRDEVIAKYRTWLNDRLHDEDTTASDELMRLCKLAEVGDLTLVCWCAPLPCHGDVIKNAIEWLNEGTHSTYY